MIGIRIGMLGGIGAGGSSWESYWASQPEVLFFGLYSEISGGQMPNKVTGSSDYLTVAGAVGSETYQCPNTAPYIAADTDYIWFRTDVSQRTTKTSELIGYDLTRTIVKYANDTPYSIEAIMILTSDVDTDKMRDDFDLSVWWDNTLSAHGNLKGNRGIGQSVWTAIVLSDTFTDTNNVHIHDHVMDVGAGWTAGDDWIISSNKVNCTDTNLASYAVAESGYADAIITLDITIPDSGSYVGGLCFRYQDDTHRWRFWIERDGVGTPYVVLYEDTTERGRVNIVHELITAKLKVTCMGNLIKCFWKDMVNPLIEYESSSYNTLTKHGIFSSTVSTYVFLISDNFLVTV